MIERKLKAGENIQDLAADFKEAHEDNMVIVVSAPGASRIIVSSENDAPAGEAKRLQDMRLKL